MYRENWGKRVISFFLTLTIGLFIAGISEKRSKYNEAKLLATTGNFVIQDDSIINEGRGSSGKGNHGNLTDSLNPLVLNSKYPRIISKPYPRYNVMAHYNRIEGLVRLNVTFLADGEIGDVTPIKGLPFGLTEQAASAAKQIKFEPARKNGKPVTAKKIVEYNFAIYEF